MMYLSKTNNCNYLEIKSETLSDFISNSANYTNLTITTTINCCDDTAITSEINEDVIDLRKWTLNFPVDSTLIMQGLYFEDIYTGQQWNAFSTTYPVSTYMCSTGDITLLFPIIQAWFTANFGVTVTQTYTYNAINNVCTYEITDLPTNIKPVNLHTKNVSGVDLYTYFEYFPINNLFFTANSMVMSPQYFGGNEFVDGIYSVELTFTTESGNIITEKNCFFLDCKTACEVSTKLKELQKIKEVENATNIFLLHYTLTEGSNCGCNCSELCELFRKLCLELNSSSCLCGCV